MEGRDEERAGRPRGREGRGAGMRGPRAEGGRRIRRLRPGGTGDMATRYCGSTCCSTRRPGQSWCGASVPLRSSERRVADTSPGGRAVVQPDSEIGRSPECWVYSPLSGRMGHRHGGHCSPSSPAWWSSEGLSDGSCASGRRAPRLIACLLPMASNGFLAQHRRSAQAEKKQLVFPLG